MRPRYRANTMKDFSSVIEDFESIRQYLSRLENERARSLSARSVDINKTDAHKPISISRLWISGKT